MKRTKRCLILILAVLLTALVPASSQDNDRPNIIFIIADDMTRNMFNFLSPGTRQNLTPSIDRLVDEGIVMMEQLVVSTVCTPSRYNTLSGKFASRATNPDFLRQTELNEGQRVVEWNTHIMPGEDNLPSILRQNGYRTGAVGKNHVFEVDGYIEVPLTADADNKRVMKRQLANYNKTIKAYKDCGFDFAGGIFYENPDFNGPRKLAVHNLDWTTEAAIEFLESDDTRPFFLYFATTLPHGPQEATRAWNANRLITPIGILSKEPDVLPNKTTIPERLRKAGIELTDPKANLLWLDDAVGALLRELEKKGKLENTIIFFFNDHGQFGKGTIYQGATLNPSIVWQHGGFRAGNVSYARVINTDFAPTILEMAGIDPNPYHFDGESFLGILNGDEDKPRDSFYFEIGYARGVIRGKYKYIALRYPEWVEKITLPERKRILDDYNKKLAVRGKKPNNLDPMAPFGHVQIIPGGGDAEFPATRRYPYYADRNQLYDLEKDPTEQVNLYGKPGYEKVTEEMQDELKKYLNTIPGKFGELKTVE